MRTVGELNKGFGSKFPDSNHNKRHWKKGQQYPKSCENDKHDENGLRCINKCKYILINLYTIAKYMNCYIFRGLKSCSFDPLNY